MGKIVAVTWVTLDGVMQAPAGPDEDTRDDRSPEVRRLELVDRAAALGKLDSHQGSSPESDHGAQEAGIGRSGGARQRDLLQSLMQHDLVDEFLLSIHPLVLGAGHRLPQPRMFTAREITTATVTNDASDCSIINNLAQAVSGIVSVGLKAVALVKDV